jgi:multidrug resistance efflux pump
MEEARAVLHRLERIETLEREGATTRSLLAEVHALLAEAEAWVAAERGGTDLAEQALRRCRDAVATRGGEVKAAEAVPG